MSGLDLRSLIPGLEDMLLLDTVRISEPAGPPVLDEETGLLVPTPGAVLYEGPGAMFPASGGQPGIEIPVAGQPYPDDPKSMYRMLTPIAAPPAPRDAVVTVLVSARDTALVGRSWRCSDAALAASQVVFRITWCDQLQPGGA